MQIISNQRLRWFKTEKKKKKHRLLLCRLTFNQHLETHKITTVRGKCKLPVFKTANFKMWANNPEQSGHNKALHPNKHATDDMHLFIQISAEQWGLFLLHVMIWWKVGK